jgi:hypothetical protein
MHTAAATAASLLVSGHQLVLKALLPLPLLLYRLPCVQDALLEISDLLACALDGSMRLSWWAWQSDLLMLVVRNIFCLPQFSKGCQRQTPANT